MLDSLTWTDERVALFKQMHEQGYSFAAMGDALGISKNACIGKAARLKLPARRISVDRPRQKRKKQPSTPRGANKLRIVRAGYGNGLRVSSSVTTDLPIFTCVDPESLNKSLVELGANECKYIGGDPREAALYCGHPVFKRSFCEAHFHRCYTEPLNRWDDAA